MIDDDRLPEDIERGAVGGPVFSTRIVEMSSGHEKRNENWAYPRQTWDIGYGMQRKQDYEDVREFFYARRGKLRGFLFKDWTDFEIDNQSIGIGATATPSMPIFKRYESGGSAFDRRIYYPIADTLVVTLDDVPTTAFTLSLGVITFNTPADINGKNVRVTCEFDIPVRFDVDAFPLTVEWMEAAEIPSLPIIELRQAT